MSPGDSGAIWVAVTGVTLAGCGVGSGASPASWSFWNSQNLIVCGTPFSVTVKSLAVRPSMRLPFLSLTLTISTTSCVLDVNLGMVAGVAAGGVVCCAVSPSGCISEMQVTIDRMMRLIRILEPHPQIHANTAHRVGRHRQPELRVSGGRIPGRVGHVIQ